MTARIRTSNPITVSFAKWIAVGAFVAVAVLGWRSVTRTPVRALVFHGAVHAAEDELSALGRVPMDSLLFSVSPTVIADRMRRHPWVADAGVSRLPTGTVSVRLTERIPVLLALSSRGEPAYYVDATGHRMPYAPGASWPVPILTGLSEPYHPVVPVRSESVRSLAAALTDLDESVDALLSEFHVDGQGGITLLTTVTPQGRTLRVRLGNSVTVERLNRLRAFWEQVVLARPDARYSWVDLRFDSQIVTKETS